MGKAWMGRFEEENSEIFERLNRSLEFDIRLYKEDIKLNKVYSKELNRIGIISDEELENILSGLDEVEQEIEQSGIFAFPNNTEDIHMGVEELLAQKIGDAAKKMHTGKSRNDQVVTDVRLWTLNNVKIIIDEIKILMTEILKLAENNTSIVMPGYTHLRQAQPVLLSHYLLSFFYQLERDLERFNDSLKRISILPLGSGALAGSGFDINRENLRKDLGFDKISNNSMDIVLSRDFIIETLSNIAILSTTLSRLAEDFIIFTSENFNFFVLSDKITTGSSIMPNKKNPDSLELTRGKTGRIFGNLIQLLTVVKALPSTYNKDLQEDKEALFDSVDTIINILRVNVILFQTIKINEKAIQESIAPESFATELADYLASKNLPFREAHHIVGKIVLDCEKNNIKLTSLKEADLVKYSKSFYGIGDQWFKIEKFLNRRNLIGGTGPKSVQEQIKEAKNILSRF